MESELIDVVSAGTGAPALQVAGLDVKYGPVHAVRSASLTVPPGEVVALIGETGSGKDLVALDPGDLARAAQDQAHLVEFALHDFEIQKRRLAHQAGANGDL